MSVSEGNKKIIVERRMDGYLAHLEGHKESVFGFGKSADLAIAALIRTYPRSFNITIESR